MQGSRGLFIILLVPSTPKTTAVFILAVLGVLVAGCARPYPDISAGSAWLLEDLRALQAPDASLDPQVDLIAAYARQTTTDVELRFDILGSPDAAGYQLVLLLDTQPGGANTAPWRQSVPIVWDLAEVFPAQGMPRVFRSSGEPAPIRPRILRLAVLDAAVIRLSKQNLAGEVSGTLDDVQFQAFLFRPGETQPADSIGPLRVGAPAQMNSAGLLLTFWDVLPSATPAQALRRWDGAHTGPYGQRHGLSILLEASAAADVPVALLDLKRADWLAALDAMNGMDTLRTLLQKRLVILPDVLYGDPLAAAAGFAYAAQAGDPYRLPHSTFLYGSLRIDPLPKHYQAAFTRLESGQNVVQWENLRLLPLAEPTIAGEEQVGQEGLSVAARTALVEAALSGDAGRLVVLGGSLPGSPWGDSYIAGPSFEYIAGHPWINALNEKELLELPAQAGAPTCPDLLCQARSAQENPTQTTARQALQSAPDGIFTDIAWNTYFKLTESTANEDLRALRVEYLGQIGALLAASRWNTAPYAKSDCTEDLDWDGAPECVLSSTDLFLVIDPDGGRLALAAARAGNTPYQIIGPRSQLVAGLGDPLEWRLGTGLAADPQEIPGAFADPVNDWQIYQVENGPGSVRLHTAGNDRIKTFQITEAGFEISVNSSAQGTFQVPLILANPDLWKPGWYGRYYTQDEGPGKWSWGLRDGAKVTITAQEAETSASAFQEGLALLARAEDPNFGYPGSFYLPFPLAVLDIQSKGSFSIQFNISTSGR